MLVGNVLLKTDQIIIWLRLLKLLLVHANFILDYFFEVHYYTILFQYRKLSWYKLQKKITPVFLSLN